MLLCKLNAPKTMKPFKAAVESFVSEKMAAFPSGLPPDFLADLEPAEGERILKKVRAHKTKLVRVNGVVEIICFLIFSVILVAGFVITLFSIILPHIGPNLHLSTRLLGFLQSLVSLLAFFLVCYSPLLFIIRKKAELSSRSAWLSTVGWPTIGLASVFWITNGQSVGKPEWMVSSAWNSVPIAAGSLFATITMMIIIGQLTGIVSRRINSRFSPDSVVVVELFEMIVPNRIASLPRRGLQQSRALMMELETVASRIESDFPRLLSSGDEFTDSWVANTAKDMAAAQRSFKQLLCFNEPHSLQIAQQAVTESFLAAVDAKWGQLPRVSVPKLTRKQRFALVGSTFRSVLIAALPLATLVLLKRANMELADELTKYLHTVAYVWAIVALLSALDPNLQGRIKSFREFVRSGALPGAAKGSSEGG